nr:hypothetical protein [Tanacetum cinerariifolium]
MKAEMEEEDRIAKEKNEANIAVIKDWDDVQATTDADKQLAEQLQAQEREQLSIEERSKLLTKLIEFRRKYFTAKELKRSETSHQKKIVEERLKKTQAKVTKGNSKRAGDEIEQESAKRQRLEKEDDTAELKRCLEIVPEDDNDNMVYYLLVEKMYLFTKGILHQMWKDVRIQVDYEVEMSYDLLRLIRRQINEGYIHSS